MAAELGDLGAELHCLGELAIAHAELGIVDDAAVATQRCVVLAGVLGTPLAASNAFEFAGTVAAIDGRALDAAWLVGAAAAAIAPEQLADVEDNDNYGHARHWLAARRSVDAVAWQIAVQEGREADRDASYARVLQVPQPAIENGRTPIRVRHGQLTPREVEILTLVGQGRSDPEIAERLFISPKTASVHVANVKAKLGAASRLETALRARDMGLVTGDPRS